MVSAVEMDAVMSMEWKERLGSPHMRYWSGREEPGPGRPLAVHRMHKMCDGELPEVRDEVPGAGEDV